MFLLSHGGSLLSKVILSLGMKLLMMFTIVSLNNTTWSLISIRESLFYQSKSFIALSIDLHWLFRIFKLNVHMEVDNGFLRLKLEKTIWWWQFGCNDELVTKFPWEVNIRSIQETEDLSICVGSWMICIRPYWAIKSFKIDPLWSIVLIKPEFIFGTKITYYHSPERLSQSYGLQCRF